MKERTFLLTITLVGDEVSPDLREIEQLVAAQMSGPLDDDTQLFCAAVDVIDEEPE